MTLFWKYCVTAGWAGLNHSDAKWPTNGTPINHAFHLESWTFDEHSELHFTAFYTIRRVIMPTLFVCWITVWFGFIGHIAYQATNGNRLVTWHWNLLGCLSVAFAGHITYCLVLYPRYLTPFKNLPTPTVGV